MTTEQKIQYIAKHYGYEPQSRQLIEEMAELTVAINKFWRKLGNGQRVNKSASECIQNLVEEIADVQVMVEQVKYLLSIREDEVSDIIEQKLDRQIERIKNEIH